MWDVGLLWRKVNSTSSAVKGSDALELVKAVKDGFYSG
jgi:hypothetical protein